MTEDLKALGAKLDRLVDGQERANVRLDAMDDRLDRLDRNFNGDGSPKDRGWAGVIADLQAQVNGLTARAAYALTWINAVGTMILAYWFAHSNGGKP